MRNAFFTAITGDYGMNAASDTSCLPVILASSSPYRAQALTRLQLPFEPMAPDVDERLQAGEQAANRAQRLARSKALAVAQAYPGRIVIGSDQVATLDERILRKPGNAATAQQQLTACSGQRVHFYTAVHVAQWTQHNQRHEHALDTTIVHFRHLTMAEIIAYIQREKPFDCAGSFKCEGLGISLFKRIENTDPSALIGLPLIATCALLRAFDYPLLTA